MGTVWKFLLPLALVLPLGAYVVGSVAAREGDPAPRQPIVIESPRSEPGGSTGGAGEADDAGGASEGRPTGDGRPSGEQPLPRGPRPGDGDDGGRAGAGTGDRDPVVVPQPRSGGGVDHEDDDGDDDGGDDGPEEDDDDDAGDDD